MSARSASPRSSPLRQRMIRELQLQRKSPQTIKAYVMAVRQLAEHYGRSPKDISHDEVREFLRHLIVDRKLAHSSVNQKLAGIRFLYRRVLGQTKFDLRIDRKRSGRLPQPLGREERRWRVRPVQRRDHHTACSRQSGKGGTQAFSSTQVITDGKQTCGTDG